MRVTDEQCEELKRLYLEEEGVSLTLDEAREMLSRIAVLVERFAAWVVREKAKGRVFPIDERPPAL